MMILIDSDGDGTLSLEEVEGTHAKFFKAIDTDKVGKGHYRGMDVLPWRRFDSRSVSKPHREAKILC